MKVVLPLISSEIKCQLFLYILLHKLIFRVKVTFTWHYSSRYSTCSNSRTFNRVSTICQSVRHDYELIYVKWGSIIGYVYVHFRRAFLSSFRFFILLLIYKKEIKNLLYMFTIIGDFCNINILRDLSNNRQKIYLDLKTNRKIETEIQLMFKGLHLNKDNCVI